MNTESKRHAAPSLPRKNILVVDDDPSILCHLEVGLSAYPGLVVVTAENGVEALARMKSLPIDLVVTDIEMPEMDGLGLVSHLSRNHPRLPVVVMTAYGSETTEDKLGRLGIVSYLKKPLKIDELAERIFDLLVGVDSGYVHGISIASFLQLLHADTKTCCLRVTFGERTGYLHFVDGEIWDAAVDDVIGKSAAMEIVSWEEDLTIDIQNLVRLRERTIDMDVTFLIMEAIRRKDEAASGIADDRGPSTTSGFQLPERGSLAPEAFSGTAVRCEAEGVPVELSLSSKQQFLLYEALTRLRDIPGYKACALLSHSGNVLISHAVGAKDDIETAARGIHEMFVDVLRVGRALHLDEWEETVFRSASGAVLFRCSARASVPHVHMVAVTDDLPAEGLLRIRLKRAMEEITEKLAEMIGNR